MAFAQIPLADLTDNDYNPRRRIEEDRIAELAQSIERVGLISPLTVRPIDGDGGLVERIADDQFVEVSGLPDGTYELVVEANPDGTFLESDPTNNKGGVVFRWADGDVVEVLDRWSDGRGG